MKHIKELLELLNSSHVNISGDKDVYELLKRAATEFERLQSQPDASDLLKCAADRLQEYISEVDTHGDTNDVLAMRIYEHLKQGRSELCESLSSNITQTMKEIADGNAKPKKFKKLCQLTKEKQTLC